MSDIKFLAHEDVSYYPTDPIFQNVGKFIKEIPGKSVAFLEYRFLNMGNNEYVASNILTNAEWQNEKHTAKIIGILNAALDPFPSRFGPAPQIIKPQYALILRPNDAIPSDWNNNYVSLLCVGADDLGKTFTIQNGGVISLLSHIYQALQVLFGNGKVVA